MNRDNASNKDNAIHTHSDMDILEDFSLKMSVQNNALKMGYVSREMYPF